MNWLFSNVGMSIVPMDGKHALVWYFMLLFECVTHITASCMHGSSHCNSQFYNIACLKSEIMIISPR